eukprot:TRINITY_DN50450_c0_g1_i1.p1 TRINITY_DN50450_c0_g1~~TRINITY_DN50450_c0_g1_i1.p1  ORF type:complete len:634 (-),score=118.83 TRINITY_DN50450_c0_g1_i1:247-2148(-)
MRIMASRVFFLASLSVLFASTNGDEAEEGSCSAADMESGSCQSGQEEIVIRSRAQVEPGATADLIDQEVNSLEEYVSFCEGRISMLEDLRDVVDASVHFNTSIPNTHLRALRENVTLLSSISHDTDIAPISSHRDFLLTKAVIRETESITSIQFLPLRVSSGPYASGVAPASTSTASVVPSALLVAARADGIVRLFTPSGELVLSFSAGHDYPITHLAISPSHDEHLISTGDTDGAVRVHKVTVRAKRLPVPSDDNDVADTEDKTGERVSQFFGSQLNVSARFQTEFSIPAAVSDGETSPLTAMSSAHHQGATLFVLGDAKGTVSVFAKNGTLKGQIEATNTPGHGIEGFFHHVGNLLFRAGPEWGYIDLEKLEVRHMDCPGFDGNVKDAIIDNQLVSRVFVADSKGGVSAFHIRNKKDCKIEHAFRQGSVRRNLVHLASVRGFVLALEGPEEAGIDSPSKKGSPVMAAGWSLVALNMSHVGKRKQEAMLLPSPVAWRRFGAPLRSWAVQNRHFQGDLLALLSENGRELEVVELLMPFQQVQEEDSFGDFQLPMIGLIAVLVLGYQYKKQKGKFSAASPSVGSKKRDIDSDLFKKSLASDKLAALKSKGKKDAGSTDVGAKGSGDTEGSNKPA